jgi:hypothetical protein
MEMQTKCKRIQSMKMSKSKGQANMEMEKVEWCVNNQESTWFQVHSGFTPKGQGRHAGLSEHEF